MNWELRILNAAMESDGDKIPLPSFETMEAAKVLHDALLQGGVRGDCLEVAYDALGGITLTIGDSSAHVRVSVLNTGTRSVSYLVFGERERTMELPPIEQLVTDVWAFLKEHE